MTAAAPHAAASPAAASNRARGVGVVTGAAGSLATDILDGLLAAGWTLRAVDLQPVTARPGLEPVVADVQDEDTMVGVLRGASAVVHLAGIPLEDEWDRLARVNIDGTYRLLEAARRAGVPRVVLASSIHAVGFHPVPDDGSRLDDDLPIRPDTLYGVSKAAVEALGSLYADRHGLEVIALRIASRQAAPTNRRTLRSWLSPADATALVDAAMRAPAPGFRTVWGVSANTGGYLSPEGGEALGYHPRDDAATARARVEAIPADQDASSPWIHLLGGEFCSENPPRMAGPEPGAENLRRST